MTNFEFLIWLLGFLELCDAQPLSRKMLFIIKNHGNLVKAVEKEGLGPLNSEIYRMVSDALCDSQQTIFPMLFDLLKEKAGTHFAVLGCSVEMGLPEHS